MSDVPRRGRRILAVCAVAACSAIVASSGASARSEALVKDWDGDGALAPADCRPLDPAVYPGAPDKPDVAFEDTNCDGIDGDLSKAIFVDGGGGLDTRSGAREFPKKTITNALAAAKAAGKDVYVAAGTYAESLALEPNVGIYGGYTPNFSARSLTEPTTITGGPQAALADGDIGVVLQLLTFQGAAAAPGGSSYGLRIVNNAKVAVQRVLAAGGTAGAGGVGSSGPTGNTGGNGTTGNSSTCGTSQAGSTTGGSGGGSSGGSGGAGGTSAGGGANGVTGSGTAGGFRGAGGGGANGGANQTGGNGGPGLVGGPGAAGPNATPATFTPEAAGAGGWAGTSGTTATAGTGGSGGGGGGGGGAAYNAIYNAPGGGGGSGGAGGGGGNPGGGGTAGGASFGVYIYNASLVSRDATLRGGTGGAGGNGGTGGTGGDGGLGRTGGNGVDNCGSPGVYSSGGEGGSGGNGGMGGKGGDGSGGVGGPSAAVFRSGAGSSYSPGTTTTTQVGTPGSGGRVGTSGALSASGSSLAVLVSTTAGTALSDFDGDGVVDTADNCPTAPAAGGPSGCPVRPPVLVDTDGDGVPNVVDACPTVAVSGPDVNEDGCTDVVATPTRRPPRRPPPRRRRPRPQRATATATAIPTAQPTAAPTVLASNAPTPSGIDGDGDGFFAGQDCNDANAAIRPGAVEIKGNRIDENCDGTAEPFPTLGSGVVTKWSSRGSTLTLTVLQVTQQFPTGWKVQIKCAGSPKCAFRTKNLKAGKVSRGASSVLASLPKKQRSFKAGQTIEVWVSAPNFNTKVARFRLRKGKIPTTEPFCAVPGQITPSKTCN